MGVHLAKIPGAIVLVKVIVYPGVQFHLEKPVIL